jgi:hypothetical protein
MSSDTQKSLTIARALLQGGAGPSDPAVKAVQVLLSGFGYNFFDPANAARANDQLVRAHASGLLAEAALALVKLEGAFRAAKVPPSTSQQPFPPAEAVRTLRQIDGLRRRLVDLGSALLTLETPGGDRIWARLRNERELVERLLATDVGMISGAQRVAEATRGLGPDAAPEQLPVIEAAATELDQMLRDRRGVLSSLV